MRINPPTLFWILIAAIVAADRFLPMIVFAQQWMRWTGAGLVILGIGVSVAGKSKFQRVGTNVYTFEEPGDLVTDGSTASAAIRCISVWCWQGPGQRCFPGR